MLYFKVLLLLIYYERSGNILEEEYTRRKQQRPASASKKSIATVILLLIINTLILCLLLFLNVQAESKQDEKLNSIEQQVRQLDQRTIVQAESTEKNVPIRESSASTSTSTDSSSSSGSNTMESSSQTEDTHSSSEVVQHQTVEPTATTYTVQAGDTLSAIAEKNKLSVQDLMTKNNLTDSTVYIGQVLSLQ